MFEVTKVGTVLALLVEQGGVVGCREKDNHSSIAHPSPSSFTRLPSQDVFKEFVFATHLSWFLLATQVGHSLTCLTQPSP